jgi:hypothetical protein
MKQNIHYKKIDKYVFLNTHIDPFEEENILDPVKGTLTRDFRPLFFHQTTSPGPLIQRLNPFRIWLRICEDNRQS